MGGRGGGAFALPPPLLLISVAMDLLKTMAAKIDKQNETEIT